MPGGYVSGAATIEPTQKAGGAVKATVDTDLCIGCELCTELCPEAFRMGDDGYSHPTADVFPDELYGCIRDAADACPVSAIDMLE